MAETPLDGSVLRSAPRPPPLPGRCGRELSRGRGEARRARREETARFPASPPLRCRHPPHLRAEPTESCTVTPLPRPGTRGSSAAAGGPRRAEPRCRPRERRTHLPAPARLCGYGGSAAAHPPCAATAPHLPSPAPAPRRYRPGPGARCADLPDQDDTELGYSGSPFSANRSGLEINGRLALD